MPGPTQVFLDIDGIKGDAEPSEVKDYIRVYSFNWGTSTPVRSSIGSGSDRLGTGPVMSNFSITKDFDISTAQLTQFALTNNTKGVKMVVKFLRTGTTPEPLAIYTFSNCIVSSYRHHAGAERPTETLTVDYTELMFESKQLQATGAPGGSPKVTYKNPTQQAS